MYELTLALGYLSELFPSFDQTIPNAILLRMTICFSVPYFHEICGCVYSFSGFFPFLCRNEKRMSLMNFVLNAVDIVVKKFGASDNGLVMRQNNK